MVTHTSYDQILIMAQGSTQGNIEWTHVAHLLPSCEENNIIEIWLDTDDRLHTTYLEHMQHNVLHDIVINVKNWMHYHGARYYIEWMSLSSSSLSSSINNDINIQCKGDMICFTSGLILALNISVKEEEAHRSIHSNIIKYLSKICNNDSSNNVSNDNNK